MIGRDKTSEVIGRIYDSIDIEQGWMPVLSEIAQDFDAGGVHLFLRNIATGEALEDSYHGDHSDELKAEFQRLLHTDPAWPIGRQNPGKIINCVDYYDDALFESTPAYNEVMKHIGCRYRLTSTLPIQANLVVGVAVTHPKTIGAFTNQHVARLDHLLPHMVRAVQLQRRLRRLERDAADVMAALDRLPVAALIVSESLEIVCMNRQADDLLGSSKSLRVRRRELVPALSSEASALRKGVGDAIALADGAFKSPHMPPQVVEISRPEKLPLSILAVPLRPRYRLRQSAGHGARVLLMVYDPEYRSRIDPSLIERLFELTPTEAVIAAQLADGRSIAEIARDRRCSASTVRSHLKSIFQKTGTNRQGELVQMLLTSPAVSFLE